MGASVIVGLSGGVDSSVAALLLLEQGYDVRAVFMKNWLETLPGGQCLWEQDVEDAMGVCDRLGIPLNTIDLSRTYWDRVFARFLEAYRAGLTPNPDIVCNQEVKFKAFREHALALGAAHLATGHYARCLRTTAGWSLARGLDAGKDQSYFLCMLTQQQLEGTLFPVGALRKAEVRKRAARAGLATHDKKDSTGICFVGERPFREFLAQFLPVTPGDIHDEAGNVIGHHDGIHFYTIGQRSGLRIGGIAGRAEAPWYVAAKDAASNTLVAVQGQDHPLLFSRWLAAAAPNWIAGHAPDPRTRLAAKTRYHQPDQACDLDLHPDGTLQVRFDTPQRAVAPGQYVVFYDGETCLGGAVITAAGR